MFDAATHRRADEPEMPPPAYQIAAVFSEQADFVWRSLRRLGVPVADVDDGETTGTSHDDVDRAPVVRLTD